MNAQDRAVMALMTTPIVGLDESRELLHSDEALVVVRALWDAGVPPTAVEDSAL